MKGAEQLNEKLRKRFLQCKNYENFEKYVMSELLSPIEDYYNFIALIEENKGIIEGFNLYFIAAYINSWWSMNNNSFIQKINDSLEKMSDLDKAITYYLNAINDENSCIENLEKSIALSKNIKFVKNRLELAKRSYGSAARALYDEAKNSVVEVYIEEDLKLKSIDWWLRSQGFIDEFILGTHISDSNFKALLKICDAYK